MRQGGQQERLRHGVDGIYPTISGYIAAICGLLVTGPLLDIISADLWLEPSWCGAITLGLSVLLMGIVLRFFLATMAIGSGTGGALFRGR